jgi:hypothetical protein
MKKTLLFAGSMMATAFVGMAQTKNAGPWVLDPENLDRGVIVVPAKVTNGAGDGTSKGRLVNWRCLATDGDSVTFTIIKNGEVITTSQDSRMTSYHDPTGLSTDTYRVTVRRGGKVTERPTTHYLKNGYLELKLDRPAGGTTATGAYTYRPNDCSVGDVDGDGEYEIILKWDPTNSTDNGQSDKSLQFCTGNVLLDCYKLDGTKLWRIDLGCNIRAGAHYTQFIVYDLDGDGKAELACKTAPGTIDGLGNYVLMGDDDPTKDYRATVNGCAGIIKTGPEYLTVFDGQTGANRCTVSYVPLRTVQADGKGDGKWGDTYANRSERYLACVAYLDGQHPSLVMCRGYYTASYLCAWDFDGTNLTQRWLHASEKSGQGAYGEGAHGLSVGDVDGDGCDEIVYGSACIDHDGTLLYRTGFGHGDALHLGDFDPDREGLEVFMVHEETGSTYPYDTEFRDAKTGKVIWGLAQSGHDIGRGLAADIDSTRRGVECWPIKDYTNNSTNGESAVFSCTGVNFSSNRPSVNFGIYYKNYRYQQCFDASESSNTAYIQEWNQKNKKMATLVDFAKNYKVRGCNSTKGTPCLQADILGDWREEVVLYDSTTFDRLLIFSSPYVTTDVIPTFMHDHQYRMAVAWQNVAYNQPPHLSYYLPDFDYDTYIEKLKASTSAIERVSTGGTMDAIRCIALPGKLQLLCKGLEGQSLRLRILDMSGRTLREEAATVGSDASVMVETESLTARHGIYLVSLTSEVGQWGTKVVL